MVIKTRYPNLHGCDFLCFPGEVLWEFLGGDVPLGPWHP